jgi:nucleoside-diphosphate-sugar epimerase
VSKLAAEELLRTFGEAAGIQVAILRFAEIYGYNKKSQTSQSMVNFLVDHMLAGSGIGMFSVDKEKDHLHLSDAVRALQAAILDQDTAFCRVDIGPGEGVVIKDLIEKIRELTGYSGRLEYLEHPSAKVIDSVSDPKLAKKLWGFECEADLEKELIDLIKRRRKEIK